MPHPLALFSLVPASLRAEQVVAHPRNSHLASTVGDDGTPCLDIGHALSKYSHTTLATLGRGDVDVYIEGSSISKLQCSFEIEPRGQAVMLYDRSHSKSTQVFGDDAMPFEDGRLRKVAVNKGLNTTVGIGGPNQDIFVFRVLWHVDVIVKDAARVQHRQVVDYRQDPPVIRTINIADITTPSPVTTAVHTPGQPGLRYRIYEQLGARGFSTLYKALDVDAGRLIAVKVIDMKTDSLDIMDHMSDLEREVEILTKSSHPHIIDYISSQGWGGPRVEIFTALNQGTLESLVMSGAAPDNVGDLVLKQMLQALDFLATHNIIHRDVKPANIFYTVEEGRYRFQLGDVGEPSIFSIARISTSNLRFMAPEMLDKTGRRMLTHKVDIWSLYATILWTVNINGFRQEPFRNAQAIQEAAIVAAEAAPVTLFKDMARKESKQRASAAQMIVKLYNGEGLATPWDIIPPLQEVLPLP